MDSHHTPRLESPLFSKQVRLARPVDIPHWLAKPKFLERRLVGVGRLALPRLFGFEPNRSAIPCEPHAGLSSCGSTSEGWSATRDLHPEGSAILSRRGLLFPLKPVAVKRLARPKLA